MELSALQKVGIGLSALLESKEDKELYWAHRDTKHVTLEVHPFGLETRLSGSGWILSQICLIANPGDTESSVRAMKIMIRQTLADYHPNRSCDFRLRITRVVVREKVFYPVEADHDLYFELITDSGVFICGGCNDYSGAGGSAGRDLETVFKSIAYIYNVPCEEVVLHASRANAIYRLLAESYNEQQERKRLKI
ncbi:hypothetical protein KBB12_03975 [Candidatus Woesebacteria bacterium]|nr:hypothetical protein [Candidatus Woesebacteria bacterium]